MFKVGDVVTMEHYGTPLSFRPPPTAHRVIRVTKTRITVDNDSVWTPDGRLWGGKSSRLRLVHYTQEHEDLRLRMDVIRSFNSQKETLTPQQLKEIWLIIGPEREK
jgi:hypothetical protein